MVWQRQAAYRVAQGVEGQRHTLAMHALGQLVTGREVLRQAAKAEEEGVGPLVSQQKGQELLLIFDNGIGELRDAFLPKQMVGDESGHS